MLFRLALCCMFVICVMAFSGFSVACESDVRLVNHLATVTGQAFVQLL